MTGSYAKALFHQIRTYFESEERWMNEAAELFDAVRTGQSNRNLFNLLEHHLEEPPSEPATYLRDGFDDLLSMYSALEVGCQAGTFSTSDFPVSFVKTAKRHLNHPAVAKYFEFNYPLLLPSLFRARIHGHNPIATQEESETSQAHYERFLQIMMAFESPTSPIETFLWFIDEDTSRGDADITDTLTILGDAKLFIKAVTSVARQEVEAEPEDESVAGFLEFSQFCLDFDSLLLEMEDSPLLQSVFWHYYGYWFDHFKDAFGAFMVEGCKRIQSWSKSDEQREVDELELANSANDLSSDLSLEGSVLRLTSGRYAWRLREILIPTRGHWSSWLDQE